MCPIRPSPTKMIQRFFIIIIIIEKETWRAFSFYAERTTCTQQPCKVKTRTSVFQQRVILSFRKWEVDLFSFFFLLWERQSSASRSLTSVYTFARWMFYFTTIIWQEKLHSFKHGVNFFIKNCISIVALEWVFIGMMTFHAFVFHANKYAGYLQCDSGVCMIYRFDKNSIQIAVEFITLKADFTVNFMESFLTID